MTEDRDDNPLTPDGLKAEPRTTRRGFMKGAVKFGATMGTFTGLKTGIEESNRPPQTPSAIFNIQGQSTPQTIATEASGGAAAGFGAGVIARIMTRMIFPDWGTTEKKEQPLTEAVDSTFTKKIKAERTPFSAEAPERPNPYRQK